MKTIAAIALALVASTAISADEHVEYHKPIPDSDDVRVANVTADTYMPSGSAVAGYFTTNKYAAGAAFGAVIEVQDVWGKGAAWGLETDCFTTGTEGIDPWLRHCIGVVIGRSAGRKDGRAMFGYGMEIAANYNDRGFVEVGYGLSIHHLPARIAAIAVDAGERVCLEQSGKVCLRLNPQNGAVEIVNGERVLASWSTQ